MFERPSKPGASVQRDAVLTSWVAAASREAARIWAEKETRVREWIEAIENEGGGPGDVIRKLGELARVVSDEESVELGHKLTMAGMLRGMAAATPSQAENVSVANAEGVFERLPFTQAIDGLAERLGLIKWSPTQQQGERLPSFMELDAANRSRAFTMAWVQDLDYLQQIHDELVETINNGETLYDWRMKHVEDVRRRGWEGSPHGEWHYQLVYQQNLAMAYTAGRYQQGTDSGFKVVRILPTLSQSPRPDHARYAGNMFRVDEGSMLPPWDFGCNCGWEWVFPEELEGIDAGSLPLLRFDDGDGSGFKWRPAAYMALKVRPGEYSGAVRDVAENGPGRP